MIKKLFLQLIKIKFIANYIDNYAKREAEISKNFYHQIRVDFSFKLPIQLNNTFLEFDHFISFSNPDVWKKNIVLNQKSLM